MSADPTTPTATYRVEIYPDAANEWRWRLIGDSGEIEADSGEGFESVDAALASVSRARTAIANATVETTRDRRGGNFLATTNVSMAGGDDQ